MVVCEPVVLKSDHFWSPQVLEIPIWKLFAMAQNRRRRRRWKFSLFQSLFVAKDQKNTVCHVGGDICHMSFSWFRPYKKLIWPGFEPWCGLFWGNLGFWQKKLKKKRDCSTWVSRMVTHYTTRSGSYQLNYSWSDGKRCFLVDMAATDSLTETQVIWGQGPDMFSRWEWEVLWVEDNFYYISSNSNRIWEVKKQKQ